MSFIPYGLVSQKRTWSYSNGWQAEQVYCLPFSEVDSFIAANYLMFYPGSDLLQVTQITDEPWMDDDVVSTAGFSNSRKVTFSFSIVYLDASETWPTHLTIPGYANEGYANSTTLKLSIKFAGQYMTLPPAAIQPAGGGPAASPNTQATQYISLNEYTVEWDRVSLGDLDFSDYIGCVDSGGLFGAMSGTLLCEGVTSDPSTILNPSDPMAYKAVVTIKERKIVISGGSNAGTYGWNDWYNPKTQQWEALTLTNGQPPYDTTDLTSLFG